MLPSGIAAVFVALLHYKPDVIAITDGYHGCHGAIEVYSSVQPTVVSWPSRAIGPHSER